MKVSYDKEVDTLYIELSAQKPDGVIEIEEGINIDNTPIALEAFMNTQTYNVQEAKIHLHRLLQAVASGAEVIIAKEGKPMVRLSRVEEKHPKIRFGVLKGKVKVSDDFDAPLPERMLAEFEGSECGF